MNPESSDPNIESDVTQTSSPEALPTQQQNSEAPVVTQVPLPPATSPKRNNKKWLLVMSILLACIVLAAASWYFFLRNKSASTVTIQQTEVAKVDSVEVPPTPSGLIQIDLQQFQANIDWSNPETEYYKDVYFFYDESGNYTSAPADKIDVYQFEDTSKLMSGSNDYCDGLNARNAKYYDGAKAKFTNAGYAVKEVNLYTQYQNCGKAFIATNAEQTCSGAYGTDPKDYAPAAPFYLMLSIACSPNDVLKQYTKDQNLILATQIQKEAGDFKDGRQLLGGLVYVKDSPTAGYRIASTAGAAAPLIYYQAPGKTWRSAGADIPDCTPKSADAAQIRKAFLGEPCANPDGSKATMTL